MAEGELRNVDAAIARHERHRQRDEHRNRNGKCHRQDGRESRARVSAFPLELAVSRMRDAAEEKDEQGFADKLAKALEVAKGAAGLVPAIVEAAGSLAGLF